MKYLIIGILAALLCTRNALSQERPAISPATIYELGGVTIQSPDQSGWVLLQATKSVIVLEKHVGDEVLSASIKTMNTKPFANDRDRLFGFEALKSDELSALKKDSVHFNHGRFQHLPCMQYDGIFTGMPESKLKYFNFKGYFCRHPSMDNVAVQLEVSSRSNTRDFSDDLIQLSEVFFEQAVFPATTSKQ